MEIFDQSRMSSTSSIDLKSYESIKEKGIKGPCALLRLEYVDVSLLCHPEYLYSILIGVVKMFTELYLGAIPDFLARITAFNVISINDLLSQIKLPVEFGSQMPLFLSKHKWKAKDYENFICRGFIVLSSMLNQEEFEILAQLSYIVVKFWQ